jgi:hypothetical protein
LNLNTLILALTSVVIGSPLQLTSPFLGSCYGHAMSKACQYAFDDSKVCVGFLEISLKNVQTSLHKTITWTNVFGKGKQE